MHTQLVGMTIVCLSGIAGGCFAFPLRLRRLYAEENTVLGAYFIAVIVIPLLVASFLFPFWPRVLFSAPARKLLLPVLCGVGWGFGSISYAQGVSRIGLALAVSTVMSLTMAIGAVIPLLSRWGAASPATRAAILTGVSVCVAGVVLFGVAGRLRDRSASAPERRVFLAGFLWSIASGVLSPLANVGFDAGAPYVEAAVRMGGIQSLSPMLGFFPLWTGGFITLLVVLGGRMLRKGTWRRFAARGSRGDAIRTGIMGVLHFLGQVPYGIGAWILGTFGTSIGWAATLGAQLLAVNGLGVLMGEWRGAPRAARLLLALGLVVVLAAVGVLAYASHLSAE